MTQYKPYSERLENKPAKPANSIRGIDRKRYTREEVEAAIKRRRSFGIYYDPNR